MSHGGDDPDDAVGLASSERQAYETRIARLERLRSSVDRLIRFEMEAYKTRIADLKRALAQERVEKQALARQLAAMHEQHQALARLLQRLDEPSTARPGKTPGEEQR